MELISSLLSFVLLYKYAALFVLFFLASAGIPFPSVTLMVGAAVFASQGYLSVSAAALTMWLGSVCGDITLYTLARSLGKRLFDHRLFKPHAARFSNNALVVGFDKHPYLIIFASRFVGFSTIAINIVSGMVRFPARRFVVTDLIAEACVTAAYMLLGYALQDTWLTVVPLVEQSSGVIILIIFLGVLLAFRKRLFGQRNERY